MEDKYKTKNQLIQELSELRQKMKRLEKSEIQRQQAQMELREGEERFRSLIENTLDVTMIIAKDGTIEYESPSVEQALGYKPEERVGKSALQLLHPDDRPKIARALQMKSNPPEANPYIQIRLRHKDGSWHVFEAIGRNLLDNPAVRGIVINFRDITERQRVEEALRKSEEAAQRLAKEAEIIAEIGRIINSTLNIEEVYERFAEETKKLIPFDRIGINLTNPQTGTVTMAYISGLYIEGRQVGDVFPLRGSLNERICQTRAGLILHPKSLEELAGQFPSLISTYRAGFRSLMSAPLISRDEVIGILHFRSRKTKVYTERDLRLAERVAAQIAGAIANAQLFLERKQAEEALRVSEEKYRLLVEHATEGIWISQDGKLKFVNPRCTEIIGYAREELLSKDLMELIHPDDRRSVMDRYYGRIKGETPPLSFESRIVARNGETKWVEWNVVSIQWNGKPAAMGFVTNITERRKLESQILQAQKMEAIGTLAGGIAHDFNNILAAIVGYTEISLFKSQDPSEKRNLEQILLSCRRAKNLVNQILSFSRRREQERKPVEVSVIVKEALKFLRSSLPTTIEIRREIRSESNIVLSDPAQIYQILMNLCTNAAQAMREKGGVLQVSLSHVEINSYPLLPEPTMQFGSYVKLTVSDTGHGMDPAIMARIFDPFFTTKKPGEATGLGLSVVYGIVKNHGGAVTVHSEPGKGATFDVYLPLVKAEVVFEVERGEPIPGGSERILFVDDEEVLVEMGREMLRSLGYEVIACASSVEALEVFRDQADRINLVITDMTMPNMTGVELAQNLLRIRPHIPIILCTGFSELITQEEAQRLGLQEFVLKPLFIRELGEKIRRVLDKQRPHQ